MKELRPQIVLGIAAHPDDLDFGASGTMAKFARQGAEVHYLILTDGGKGSEDKSMTPKQLSSIRQTEQRAAADAIGAKSATFLAHPDGELQVTLDLKKEVVKVIRTIKPDTIITMDPSMLYSAARGFINHPDHRAAGQVALDAAYPLARDHLSFPELYAEGYKPHKTKVVLLTNFDSSNYHVDISQTIDQKLAALRAHSSQISDMDATLDFIKQYAATVGTQAGYDYAESFVRIDIEPL